MSSFSYSLPTKLTCEELLEFAGKANNVAAERDAFLLACRGMFFLGTVSVVALSILNLYAGIFAFIGFGCAVTFCDYKFTEKKAKFENFLDIFKVFEEFQGSAVDLTGKKYVKIEGSGIHYANVGKDKIVLECKYSRY